VNLQIKDEVIHSDLGTHLQVQYNILLRSEIPSGMCAKLRTVAVSNNRDHARNLSYYCLFALHI